MLRTRLLLLCVSGSDQFGVGSDPLYGTPCFPFYRPRESTGYDGGKKGESEEKKSSRIVGSFFSSMWFPPTL